MSVSYCIVCIILHQYHISINRFVYAKISTCFSRRKNGQQLFERRVYFTKNNAKYLQCSESELLTLIDAIAFLFYLTFFSGFYIFPMYFPSIHSISFFLSDFFPLQFIFTLLQFSNFYFVCLLTLFRFCYPFCRFWIHIFDFNHVHMHRMYIFM